jgi:hypothetical protein
MLHVSNVVLYPSADLTMSPEHVVASVSVLGVLLKPEKKASVAGMNVSGQTT